MGEEVSRPSSQPKRQKLRTQQNQTEHQKLPQRPAGLHKTRPSRAPGWAFLSLRVSCAGPPLYHKGASRLFRRQKLRITHEKNRHTQREQIPILCYLSRRVCGWTRFGSLAPGQQASFSLVHQQEISIKYFKGDSKSLPRRWWRSLLQ